MASSPLGKYAAPAAAATSLAIIAAYLFGLILHGTLNLQDGDLSALRDLALIACGAIFGSSVAVNGYKAPLAALHRRLDAAGIPTAPEDEPAPPAPAG